MAGAKRSAAEIPLPNFKENERILCYHGIVIYEAKILRCEYREKIQQYHIHYAGWNKSWDEWVPEERIMKYNQANLDLQKALIQKAKGSKPKIVREDTPRVRKAQQGKSTSPNEVKVKGGRGVKRTASESSASTMEPRSEEDEDKKKDVEIKRTLTPNPSEIENKRLTRNASSNVAKSDGPGTSSSKTDSNEIEPSKKKSRIEKVEADNQPETRIAYAKLTINFKLPKELIIALVDEWYAITKNRQLTSIPSDYPVDKVLSDFVESHDSIETREFAKGLKDFFNVIAYTQILYKQEKPQINEYLQSIFPVDSEGKSEYPANLDNIQYSSFCGASHLLRTFRKLNCCPGMTDLNNEEAEQVRELMNKLFKFLVEKLQKYIPFDDVYKHCLPDYHRRLP